MSDSVSICRKCRYRYGSNELCAVCRGSREDRFAVKYFEQHVGWQYWIWCCWMRFWYDPPAFEFKKDTGK